MFDNFIDRIEVDKLGGIELERSFNQITEELYRIELSAFLNYEVHQDDWRVKVYPNFIPTFHWAPHLTPTSGDVIDMHVFRTPSMIMQNDKAAVCVLPNPVDMQGKPYRQYMDLDAQNKVMTLGISKTRVYEHVLYSRAPGAVIPAGKFKFCFYIMIQTQKEDIENPFRKILSFWWERFGSEQSKALLKSTKLLPVYVRRTYDWAFDKWKRQVWQEFELNGKTVGAPAFIVTVFESENCPEPYSQREELSIWNQAWFSSLRSAMGLYRYAKQNNSRDLLEKANMTKELALAFPQDNGLFDSVICTRSEDVLIEGKSCKRSLGFGTKFFGNSNRNPYTRDIESSPRHILDMSLTATLMVKWYNELDADNRLREYAENYAKTLITLQTNEGFFPAWINKDTGNISEYLIRSPESAASATFLAEMFRLTGDKVYLDSALRAVDALEKNIIFSGRWEDFETYWSCSSYGRDNVGQKFARNDMYKQNTLSMFYTAEALYEIYRISQDKKHLTLGRRCLDEMLMYQSSLQPDYFPIPVIGGFGVMNCDGELNDSRQSLFAELIIKYGKEYGNTEYVERGLAALKASFTMMYCPENPEAKTAWEKKWPFLTEKDYGFTMENYGHSGYAAEPGEGIGEFTIYDWGNGAAAEAYMRIKEHFPEYFSHSR